MEFLKTKGKPDYEILVNGTLVAWIYQQYCNQTGFWAPIHLGPERYKWIIDPMDGCRLYQTFNLLKEAKACLLRHEQEINSTSKAV